MTSLGSNESRLRRQRVSRGAEGRESGCWQSWLGASPAASACSPRLPSPGFGVLACCAPRNTQTRLCHQNATILEDNLEGQQRLSECIRCFQAGPERLSWIPSALPTQNVQYMQEPQQCRGLHPPRRWQPNDLSANAQIISALLLQLRLPKNLYIKWR